jgi:hypothetical protein
MPKLKVVKNEIKKAQAGKPPKRTRLPITPNILRDIKALWSPREQDPDIIMLWAASCVCFFGFFRAGELTVPSEGCYEPSHHLNFQDVAVDDPADPSIMRIHIKYSKTDQLGRGADVYLGRTHQDLCPVASLLAYLAVRGDGEGPLFKFANGQYLTKERFTARIREALTAVGRCSANYAGHSFRIGAATTAAEKGLEDATIKALGRWHSSAYQTYVRLPKEHLASISRTLLETQAGESNHRDDTSTAQ